MEGYSANTSVVITNDTNDDPLFNLLRRPAPQFLVVGIVSIPVGVFGAIASVITPFLIWRQRGSNSTTNALILNLCLATFFLCSISSFYDAFTMIRNEPGPSPVCCVVFAFLHSLWLSVSAHSHAAIAMHRLLAVMSSGGMKGSCLSVILCCPSHSLVAWTSVILIAYTWLVPLLVLVFPLANLGADYGFSPVASRCSVVSVWVPAYAGLLKVMNSFFPLIVMTLCYLVICGVLLRSRARFNLDEAALKGQGARGAWLLRLKAEFRVTRIAFLTCACFTICYIPRYLQHHCRFMNMLNVVSSKHSPENQRTTNYAEAQAKFADSQKVERGSLKEFC